MIKKEEIVSLLKPEFEVFNQVKNEALNLYSSTNPDLLLRFEERTKSSMIRDLYLSLLKEKYASENFVNSKELILLIIKDKLNPNNLVGIRIKKLNELYLPGNIKTNQAESFACQIPIDGFPIVNYVNLGYRINETKDDAELFLTFQTSLKQNLWVYSISEYLQYTTRPRTEIILNKTPSKTNRVKPKIININEQQIIEI